MIVMPTDLNIVTRAEFVVLPKLRQELTERLEIAAWGRYLQWHREIEPKCSFTPKGVANKHERQRRWTIFAMFKYFNFHSQHSEIQSIFLVCVGQLSLQWMAECAGTDAPPFYYEWVMESHPKNLTTWGEKVFEKLAKSNKHLEMMKELRPKQVGEWIVDGVMKA